MPLPTALKEKFEAGRREHGPVFLRPILVEMYEECLDLLNYAEEGQRQGVLTDDYVKRFRASVSRLANQLSKQYHSNDQCKSQERMTENEHATTGPQYDFSQLAGRAQHDTGTSRAAAAGD